MIVGVEIITGRSSSPEVDSAAGFLEDACLRRGFPVRRLPEPTAIDNRLCLYLATSQEGYPLEELLDRGVRRDTFARLGKGHYLVRSWLSRARLHIALASRNGAGLMAAARFVAERIAEKQDFSHLDVQGPAATAAS